MTKKMFIEGMEALDNQIAINDKNDDLMGQVFENQHFACSFTDITLPLINYTIKALAEGEDWRIDLICDFIWQWEFGEAYCEGDYVVDGVDMDVSSYEKLYHHLYG